MKFWSMMLGAVAAFAAVAVLALVVFGGDDDEKKSSAPVASTQGSGLPQFALNFPKTWARVSTEPQNGTPRAVIRRRDGSAMMTMTINGPVKQSLSALRSDMNKTLRQRFPGISNLKFERINVEAGSGLLSTWVAKNGRIQSNLVVPSGKVSYSLDAVVSPGHPKTATEVGKIYAAFDAAPRR